jgi:hypothetical protein
MDLARETVKANGLKESTFSEEHIVGWMKGE